MVIFVEQNTVGVLIEAYIEGHYPNPSNNIRWTLIDPLGQEVSDFYPTGLVASPTLSGIMFSFVTPGNYIFSTPGTYQFFFTFGYGKDCSIYISQRTPILVG